MTTNPEDPLEPGDPVNPDGGDDGEDPVGPLKPPYGVNMTPGPDMGWSVRVAWEYSYRYTELDRFEVRRQARGSTEWNVVADDIRNNVRTFMDMLPDEQPYTYAVAAYPADGSPALVSEPAQDPAGQTAYIQADANTTVPQNIRKPLRSTTQKMVIAWDYHSAASSYVLEALDETGSAYYTVRVTDVFAPYGMFVGPHPTGMVTARVTVMRRRSDGTEYAASSAEETFVVDDAADPHFGVIDIQGQASDTLNTRNLGFAAVVGLGEYGDDVAQLSVNGIIYGAELWRDHNGHKSITVEACYPAGSAVTVGMQIVAPDNLQAPPEPGS